MSHLNFTSANINVWMGLASEINTQILNKLDIFIPDEPTLLFT